MKSGLSVCVYYIVNQNWAVYSSQCKEMVTKVFANVLDEAFFE